MIKECNFRVNIPGQTKGKYLCGLSWKKVKVEIKKDVTYLEENIICPGEDQCILYQIYKNTKKPGYLDVEKYYGDESPNTSDAWMLDNIKSKRNKKKNQNLTNPRIG